MRFHASNLLLFGCEISSEFQRIHAVQQPVQILSRVGLKDETEDKTTLDNCEIGLESLQHSGRVARDRIGFIKDASCDLPFSHRSGGFEIASSGGRYGSALGQIIPARLSVPVLPP